MRTLFLSLGCAAIVLAAGARTSAAGQSAGAPRTPAARTASQSASRTAASPAVRYRAVLNQYCVSCHSDRLKTGGLTLQSLDLNNVPAHAATLEKVVRKLRAGMMPPAGNRRPDTATYASLIGWLETSLDESAARHPFPGRPLLHRLNRTEYANAIRDLLTLDVDVAPLLPADDPSFGFDNVADSLGVSPILLERYLAAAGKISALAVGDPATAPTSEFFRVRQDLSQNTHLEGMPFGTVGGVLARTTLPLDGEYILQPKLIRTNLGVMRGLETEHQLEISVDGRRVHLATFGGFDDFKEELSNQTEVGDRVDAKLRVRLPLTAGPHEIAVTFLEKSQAETTLRLQPFIRSSADTIDITGHPHLEMFQVTGPFNPTGPGDTPSRRKVFVCRPSAAADELPCATDILTTVARRAYRRPVTAAETERLLAFYREGRKDGDFERGIQFGLQRILASPNFVFRAEPEPANLAPGAAYRITDLELASRLSFFLWSSIPDDELLNLAAQNTLHDKTVLAQQVKRMLADPRAELVTNFAGQWLYLRNLKNQNPDPFEFPDFDDNLRQAFRQETEMLVGSIIQEDRSVLDLLTADYTFVNERSAKLYGIPNVYGSQMRRVKITDDARRGLLGQGAILMVTSHVDRTSPVVRGRWILENLLGAPVPAPPPNVPPLKDNDAGRPRTMRERMEEHRANPVCASCHKIMDPIGLSMENFDAVGKWRTEDGGHSIDATGELMDGTKVDGVVQLREALLRRSDDFVRTMTEKLMVYALGRGLDYHDMPIVRAIVRDAKKNDYRFSSILMGIINSDPFQMRSKALPEGARPATNVAAK